MPDIEICLGVICSTSSSLNKRGLVLAFGTFISRLGILTYGIMLLELCAAILPTVKGVLTN